MVNIFIANLDWSITSEDLKTTFSTFGDVHYAHVVFEKETKRSMGYGYIEMPSAEAAIAAIEALNGMEINGRTIDVKIASPKSNRPKKVEKKVEKKAKKPFKKKFKKFKNKVENSENSVDKTESTSKDVAENVSSNLEKPARRRRTVVGEKRYEKVERITRNSDNNE